MLIDTHAHLDDERFKDDLPDVLRRASAAGVVKVLTIGIDAGTSAAALRLAEVHPSVAAVVGIQPNHVAEVHAGDWENIVRMGLSEYVVGIGETGLDRYWDRAPFPLQEEYFVRHLQLARRLGKPVVIHCRQAEADIVRMLRAEFDCNGPIRGVMHSFSGDAATAHACLGMGLHISFAGMVTFKNNEALRTVAAQVPIDRLLIETDSPYLTPTPHRGERNEPAFVAYTAACLAAIFKMDVAAFGERTMQNAQVLFDLKARDS